MYANSNGAIYDDLFEALRKGKAREIKQDSKKRSR